MADERPDQPAPRGRAAGPGGADGVAGEYGLQMHQPEWMDELISRYHLRDPRG